MRDLNTALEEHLCHVAETQLVAQTPQHREEHHVGRDLKMVERRAGSLVEATLARAAVEPPVAERRARLASGRGGGCTVRTVHRCLLVHAQTRLNLTVRALRSDAAQPFRPAELARLVAACDPATAVGRRDAAVVLLFLDTGIRCAELSALDLADCDLPRGRLLIRHGKGNKQRVVPFARRCRAALEAYLAVRGRAPGPLVWAVTGPGQLRPGVRLQPNGLKQLLRRRGRAAHVPRCHSHRFRHTFATWAIQQDARELDVQHLLGHAGPEMVRRYTASYRAEDAARRHARFSPADQMLGASAFGEPAPR